MKRCLIGEQTEHETQTNPDRSHPDVRLCIHIGDVVRVDWHLLGDGEDEMRDTIDMAREANFNVKLFKPPVITAQHSNGSWVSVGDELKAFEALVRADERNRTWTQEHWTEYERSIAAAERERFASDLLAMYGGSVDLEAAIRARGTTK